MEGCKVKHPGEFTRRFLSRKRRLVPIQSTIFYTRTKGKERGGCRGADRHYPPTRVSLRTQQKRGRKLVIRGTRNSFQGCPRRPPIRGWWFCGGQALGTKRYEEANGRSAQNHPDRPKERGAARDGLGQERWIEGEGGKWTAK